MGTNFSSSYVNFPFYDVKRWKQIEKSLQTISSSLIEQRDGTEVIMRFHRNKKLFEDQINAYAYKPVNLEPLFSGDWSNFKLLEFFLEVLPQLIDLALLLPSLFKEKIPLLKNLNSTGKPSSSITLSQKQVASILANAFLCTFSKDVDCRQRYNIINFHDFLNAGSSPLKLEKIKCLLYYFETVVQHNPAGNITIVRNRANSPNWESLDNVPIGPLKTFLNGTIEDSGEKLGHVDFADPFIGGLVLRSTDCAQEEVLFLICPELIVSCLLCEKMDANEAILLIGAERFSNYTGYERTFRWVERIYSAPTERDANGRAFSEVIAIDASQGSNNQFQLEFVNRDLVKAFAGFSITEQSSEGIATGNWGCGVFGGDLQLKSILQLLAASTVKPPIGARPLHYFPFGKEEFSMELNELVLLLHSNNVSVGRLYKLVCAYCRMKCGQQRNRCNESFEPGKLTLSLFKFIATEIMS